MNKNNPAMTTEQKFAQANREAFISLVLYAAYFAWWYFFAYVFDSKDPDSYTYVLGFPAWFFYSCVLGYPAITFSLWIVIKLFFREIPLDGNDADNSAAI
jgi:uncharacterized membrane protein YhdT